MLHPGLKSLWHSENALRRAARSVLFNREAAKGHWQEAQRHWQAAVSAFKDSRRTPENLTADRPSARKDIVPGDR